MGINWKFQNWRPHKPFYGWWVVAACFFIALYGGGAVFYGFTALFDPLAHEFGWSYTQISLAASLRGLEMGLLAPIVGIFVDRWGPRRLIFGGVLIASLGLMLLSHTTSLGMFYGAFMLLAIGMSACSATIVTTAVTHWFRTRIGLANGITLSGFALGGLLVPGIVKLIDVYEWRLAIAIIAMGMLALCLPLSLLVRHKPEQYDQLPDGAAKSAVILNAPLGPAKAVKVDIKARQALKSGTFWHIALAMLCYSLMLSAVVMHVIPYLSSIGITRAKSSLIASAIPLTSISGRLGLGWLGDKVDKRRLMAGGFAMMGAGLLCFGLVAHGSGWMLVIFLLFFGIGYGGNNTLRASAIRDFFGRDNFGAIYGLMTGVMMLGSILGGPLAGWVFDNWGSYQPIWFVFVGVAIVALLTVATTPPVNNLLQTISQT